MPEAGEYLFSNVGFSRSEQPYVSLQRNTTFSDINPFGTILTLRFDTSQRFCIGWGDIATGERFTCPELQSISEKYEQCSSCQQRTGFNPAFYHATSVSTQQQARNAEPHILYLAYFSPTIIKVGISHAARGNARLLEQGARAAIILDTFPSADIARQYEAKIAALPGIVETVQVRKKAEAMRTAHNQQIAEQALLRTVEMIKDSLGTTFTGNAIYTFESHYFPHEPLALHTAIDTSEQAIISGNVAGMLGTFLFCKQQDTTVFIPLKKFIGYKVTVSNSEEKIALPEQQLSLF